MKKDNGGSAFPSSGGDKVVVGNEVRRTLPSKGINLRDYFAAQALATCSAYSTEDVATWEAGDFASHAYRVADAMLAERVKP